jgi:hypothetical protein
VGAEDGGRQDWPPVSLIVLGNDAAAAALMVTDLLVHPYPGTFEILVAAPERKDHPARPDPLEAVADLASNVVVVHAKEDSVAGLVNAAAFAASYPIVSQVRSARGHWTDRLKLAVGAMEVTGADVVGGASVAIGLGSAESAISRALNLSIGVGPRPSRLGASRGPVDSVQMVAIRRAAFERAGGLDSSYQGAQDWELQHRVRKAGGMVWLDPALALPRRAPGTVRDLASAFYRTGSWRRRVIAAHAQTTSWRYLMPPFLVTVLFATLAGALAGGALGITWMWWLLGVPLAYVLGVTLAAITQGHGLRFGSRLRLAWAVLVIHVSWGVGFIVGRRRSQG